MKETMRKRKKKLTRDEEKTVDEFADRLAHILLEQIQQSANDRKR
jgi:hypothetical protein